ncbi:hypothetical protein C3432_01120 [Citrobacter amalonaticus]|uniref:HTH lysR-type domain-containing protein n=1 Tax=Citrobacter amalonaticus TaxID=35703 RepID=A0A2S4S249_CITAM|nr:LysR family transcriptional regulator [Citrobacter amalonaticus]POT59363.1 hypothetical protein C3432_01120 [Citrobacter amalonaticus]POT77493.1 hypothetical protein C3436_08790 [Citrobacter amalonaticus]POU67945.1 hypothetical protein C3430_02325 [Citrobacter amalonaticus]POV07549.1 hypothetical protein C3424_02335 [Citrobacter amalonaticus]
MNVFISTKLKYFMAVMAEGSVSRASQKENISRTPMSRAIADLEFYLGFELFIRSKAGMIPSEEGTKLYNRIAPLYEELLEIERNAREEIDRKIHRVAFSADIPVSMVNSIKNIFINNDIDVSVGFIDLDNIENFTSFKNFYDILFSITDLEIDNAYSQDYDFDIFLVSKPDDSNSFESITVIYHNFQYNKYINEKLNCQFPEKEHVKIDYKNIINIIDEVNQGHGALIATRSFLDVLKINDNIKISYFMTHKMTMYLLRKRTAGKNISQLICGLITNCVM